MDIVERLRVIAQGMGSLGSIEREAADEIERLREALKRAVDLYGRPGGPWNVPSDPGSWIAEARAALGERK